MVHFLSHVLNSELTVRYADVKKFGNRKACSSMGLSFLNSTSQQGQANCHRLCMQLGHREDGLIRLTMGISVVT